MSDDIIVWNQLDLLYRNYHATVNSSIGLNPTPTLEFNASIGNEELSMGGEMAFDTASASFTKYNAGLTLNKHDFSAAVMLYVYLFAILLFIFYIADYSLSSISFGFF